MIDLQECSVLVKDKKEYCEITRIAKLQGFHWASGDSLNIIYMSFPGMLYFKKDHKTYYGDANDIHLDQHYTYNSFMGGLRKLIMRRKSIC